MNLYVTPGEIKAVAPDLIRSTTSKYDDPLYGRCVDVSRAIDHRCKRHFYPLLATRYFSGSGKSVMWVPDLISVTSISVSDDNGQTYEDLSANDYYLAVGEDFDKECSYNTILLNLNGDYSVFFKGQRSVKIVGVWGYTDDRDLCWEDSGLTLAADMAEDASSFSVADGDAEDQFGLGTALQLGRLIRIGSEYLFVTGVSDNNVTVIRARNGSTAAAYTSGEAIFLWRPPFNIVGAARITVMRDLLRAQQGYADARGAVDLGGELVWNGRWDPEALEKLRPLIRTAIG